MRSASKSSKVSRRVHVRVINSDVGVDERRDAIGVQVIEGFKAGPRSERCVVVGRSPGR